MVLDRVLSDELQLNELQQFACVGDAFEYRAQILQCFFVADAHESRKCVALACVVALRFKEGLDEFGGVWHESLVVLVDGGDCEDGVLADVGVPVLEALSRGCKEGLHEFGFTQLAQEAQGVAADELVGVLEVHSNAVAVQRVSVHPGCHSPTILLTRPRSSPASAFRLSPA